MHTNDLRYESKDSREIENGSFSLSRLRWFEEEVVDVGVRCQKLGFSGGEGYGLFSGKQSLTLRATYRKVDTTIIDD